MSKAADTIYFHYLVTPFYFPDRTATKLFIQKLFVIEGKRLETVNYIFCTDAYLLQINQQYLNHDTYTDIITFELSTSPVIADIYISIERIKENAQQHQQPFIHELLRVVFHGALHLCGYKDKSSADKAKMTSREDFYLERFFVSRGTN